MNQWANYFNKTMDFETFLDFGPGDISTKYSALLSKVVRSKDDLIKMPINEPYDGIAKSQIEEYIEHYHGAGIQHIALYTDNILDSIEALRDNGIEFLACPTPTMRNSRRRISISRRISMSSNVCASCAMHLGFRRISAPAVHQTDR